MKKKEYIYTIKSYKTFWSLGVKNIETNKNVLIHSEDKTYLKSISNLLRQGIVYGFDNKKINDYLLELIFQGATPNEIYSMKEKIRNESLPPFKWAKPIKAFFNTIDLSSFCKLENSLYDINAYYNTNIDFCKIEDYITDIFNEQEKSEILSSTENELELIKNIFDNNEVKTLLLIKENILNTYLPGKKYLLSSRDSKIGEMILLEKNYDQIVQKEKFDWIINGNCALDRAPEEWRRVILDFQKKYEQAFSEYKKDETKINLLKTITVQFPELILSEKLSFRPSLGGGHSKRDEDIIRKNNIFHYDIEGAYGRVIDIRDSFGTKQLNSLYKEFLARKFKGKQMRRYLEKYKDVTNCQQLVTELNERFDFNLESTNDKNKLTEDVNIIVQSTKTLPNIISGLLDSNFSKLYNPIAMVENRLILQIALYDISKRILEIGNTDILSINTDGFFFTTDSIDLIDKEIDKWTEFWNLKFGKEKVSKYIAKDDNNRMLLQDSVIIEATGDDLTHRKQSINKLGTKPRIVDVVLAEKIKNPNYSIQELVNLAVQANRVDLFVWVTKATKNHKLVINNKISQPTQRFLLTNTGNKIGNYNLTTDKVDKVLNLPNDTSISLINSAYPSKLPDDLDINSYIKLIETSFEKWT